MEMLGVSSMTVRRDVEVLAHRGAVMKTVGSVVKSGSLCISSRAAYPLSYRRTPLPSGQSPRVRSKSLAQANLLRKFMSYRTSEQETTFFKKNGYLIIPRQIFPEEKYNRLKARGEQLFQANTSPNGKSPAVIDCPHWRDPSMFEWIFASEMLDLVEPVLGPDIGVFASHFLQKPPAVGMRVPWHEDSAY
jgi:hypothetical protein